MKNIKSFIQINEESVNESEHRIVFDEDTLLNVLKSLVRGEEAEVYTSNGKVKMILSDIGFDRINHVLDEIKSDVKRQQ